jgi:exodeoxyribonuclease VII small subunit
MNDSASGAGGAGETPQSYEAAVERLEAIIKRLDSGQAELRETLELCREGKVLVEYCKGELDAVSGELQRLDLDDLVRKLESGANAEDSEQDPIAARSVDGT